MSLFDFSPGQACVACRTAFAYTPKILRLRIPHGGRRYCGLLFVERGGYEYRCGGEIVRAEAPAVLYLPPYCAEYEYTVLSDKAYTLQIELEMLSVPELAPIRFSKKPELIVRDAPQSLRALFLAVIRSSSGGDAVSRMTLQADIYRLLARLAECSNEHAAPADSRIAPAVQWLRVNYRKPVTSAELAAMCGLGESQLCKLFRARMGKSPFAYRTELRMREARELLELGGLNISEIADILGYTDVYAFSHAFRTEMGMSPREYMRRRS